MQWNFPKKCDIIASLGEKSDKREGIEKTALIREKRLFTALFSDYFIISERKKKEGIGKEREKAE